MTKMFALLASAALGTAALAQSTMTPDAGATPPAASSAPTDSPSSMPQPMPSTTDTSAAPSAAPGTDSTPQNQAMPSASMPTDSTSNSSAAVPPMSNPSAGVATTAQADYPVCSRTVTDKCTQRGSAHKAMRHRG